ncbi:MAG: T9SS type A sorting domain-containing protein [Ignavibacteriales bacterium]|nr:T9SS type A sorting domain-containing protein [Ignavibacteriales bacterium]
MKISLMVFFLFALFNFNLAQVDSFKVAGFRASRILQSYPENKFPNADYWTMVGKSISGKFKDYQPAGIWIVSLYQGNGITQLNFPSNGLSIPKVTFNSKDLNEEYLTKFDSEGIKVWLQLEPGAAKVDTLIDIVLKRYQHHPCVIGFGIDVEWLDAQSYSGGRSVSNDEAKRWEEKVKSINSGYSLFLKHYASRWMPTSYRGNILFVDDSQDFTTSGHNVSASFNYMANEFTNWGNSFSKNKVAFQFGYKADEWWWSQFNDPMLTIGNKLIQKIPNCAGLFWVDFTINKLFPVTAVEDDDFANNNLNDYDLFQNYPNPFNASTIIGFNILFDEYVMLKVFDLLGNEVKTIVDQYLPAGKYRFTFPSNQSIELSSGIYIYRLISGNHSQSKQLILMK